jgi:ferric iron reductase protein FhuF
LPGGRDGGPSTLVDRLRSAVDYLRISVADSGDHWLPCELLLDDPARFATVVAPTKAQCGTHRDDVATSLFVQAYAFRIATVAVGAWLLAGSLLDVSPRNMAIALGNGRPNAVNLAAASATDDASAADLASALIDGHLAPLVATAHRSCRVGAPLLWGNAAAMVAAAFAAFEQAPTHDGRTVGDRADELVAVAPAAIRHAGRLVRVGDGFAWERHSCCLWYRTESAWMCEDCSLRPASDRQERYAAMLVRQTSGGSAS